jgi:hypothetical protein
VVNSGESPGTFFGCPWLKEGRGKVWKDGSQDKGKGKSAEKVWKTHRKCRRGAVERTGNTVEPY